MEVTRTTDQPVLVRRRKTTPTNLSAAQGVAVVLSESVPTKKAKVETVVWNKLFTCRFQPALPYPRLLTACGWASFCCMVWSSLDHVWAMAVDRLPYQPRTIVFRVTSANVVGVVTTFVQLPYVFLSALGRPAALITTLLSAVVLTTIPFSVAARPSPRQTCLGFRYLWSKRQEHTGPLEGGEPTILAATTLLDVTVRVLK